MIGYMTFSSILFVFLKLFASGNTCRHNSRAPRDATGRGCLEFWYFATSRRNSGMMEMGLGVTIPKWRNNLGERIFLKCNGINPIVIFFPLAIGQPFSTVYLIIEGNLEVNLPTIWTNKKQRREEAERRERLEERRVEEKESEERSCRCEKR